MVTTAMALRSNRIGAIATFLGAPTGVALDAIVNENFTMPPGIGDVLIEQVFVGVNTFSGTYVAPAPAFDGFEVDVYDNSGVLADIVGAERFVHYGTSSARPFLASVIVPFVRILLRNNDQLHVSAPVLAGAGVTANITCMVRAMRIASS